MQGGRRRRLRIERSSRLVQPMTARDRLCPGCRNRLVDRDGEFHAGDAPRLQGGAGPPGVLTEPACRVRFPARVLDLVVQHVGFREVRGVHVTVVGPLVAVLQGDPQVAAGAGVFTGRREEGCDVTDGRADQCAADGDAGDVTVVAGPPGGFIFTPLSSALQRCPLLLSTQTSSSRFRSATGSRSFMMTSAALMPAPVRPRSSLSSSRTVPNPECQAPFATDVPHPVAMRKGRVSTVRRRADSGTEADGLPTAALLLAPRRDPGT